MQKPREVGRVAYTATVREDGSWIGLAEEDVRGYVPISGPFQNHMEAEKAANERNERLGLTKREALDIVCSSHFLRAGRVWKATA